jgi:hypothetical protein
MKYKIKYYIFESSGDRSIWAKRGRMEKCLFDENSTTDSYKDWTNPSAIGEESLLMMGKYNNFKLTEITKEQAFLESI